MQQFWDERYASEQFAYGKEPNSFLAEQATLVPLGKALCLAEGQGRNAVFLAKLGFRVTAIDLSPEGLAKAQELANENNVDIETKAIDLAEFEIESETWDLIVSISAHLPPNIRKKVHRQVTSGLKTGGFFILEAYTPKQLAMPGLGGPPAEQSDLFMSLSELKVELNGLEFLVAQETEREVNEGQFHHGESAVVQIVAKKSE